MPTTTPYFIETTVDGETQSSERVALDATKVPFTPADGADWPDPDPTTLAEAVDQAAARVQAIEDAGGNVTTLVAHTAAITPGAAYAEAAALLWDQDNFGAAAVFEFEVYVTHGGGRDLDVQVVVLDGGGVAPGTVIGSGTAIATGLFTIALTKPTADALLSVQYQRSGTGLNPTAETATLVITG